MVVAHVRNVAPVLVALAACSTPPPANKASGRCATLIAVPDQGHFFEMPPPPASPTACLAYHRARVPVLLSTPPAGTARLLLTRSGMEIVRDGQLESAWYGQCDGTPPIRVELGPEVPHYMIRHLALTGAANVELWVGRKVNAVDLTFVADTLVGQGMQVYLRYEPVVKSWDCVDVPESKQVAQVSPSMLRTIVMPRSAVFASCFSRLRSGAQCSQLKRSIDLKIAPSGAVTEVLVNGAFTNNPGVDACIEAAAWDLVFLSATSQQRRQARLPLDRCERIAGGVRVPLPGL